MDELSQSDVIIKNDEPDHKFEIDDEAIKTGEYTLFLTFLLGKEIFGIPVSSVKEVMDYNQVFKTPGVPPYIKGVINLRGDVVPVIDLTYRFYNQVNTIQKDTGIVVVELENDNETIYIGIMIDAVRAVTEIRESDIDEVPDIGTKIRPDFISGIGKENNEFIILLDTNTILNIAELSNF